MATLPTEDSLTIRATRPMVLAVLLRVAEDPRATPTQPANPTVATRTALTRNTTEATTLETVATTLERAATALITTATILETEATALDPNGEHLIESCYFRNVN